ncbi:DUF6000 family protein [Plantactinospora soyae]|uniref:Uncharacterized protein n=1 Tax=Plantactinospora soyae TaxID=1544732 RepID=A0A927MGM6_9ACTN|nr:DUF6000 family protein [Plantactinospora soyae]MBE1492741.1 hypothetical protein [Plantactinospora soyae]
MEPPTPSPDPETTTRRYVTGRAEPADGYGRYLELLHGNFTALPDERRGPFLRSMRDDARQVSDAELEFMLQPGRMVDWRTRLTAAWLIGFDRRTRFRAMLGGLLLASELVYAGQGYCFALSRFGQPEDATILAAYLDRYLPQTDRHYNQPDAMGGLLHLDYQLGTTEAARFLGPDGLWSRSAFARQDPVSRADRMALLCDIAEWIMTTD